MLVFWGVYFQNPVFFWEILERFPVWWTSCQQKEYVLPLALFKTHAKGNTVRRKLPLEIPKYKA